MFSDVSDDEPDFQYRNVLVNRTSWPYLQLHEEDEFNVKFLEARRANEQKGEGLAEPAKQSDYYRDIKLMRFCDSIKGFHKGKLDLTGRHLPRYISLFKRWNAFLFDFINLSLTVESHQTEREVKLGHSRTRKFIEIEYTMKDGTMWDDFVKKWHVSRSSGYQGLVGSIQDVLDQLSRNPLPKIQSICLLDLPTEILDIIFKFATIQQARLLSSVCHKLREIGKLYIFITRTLSFDFPFGFFGETRNKGPEELIKIMIPTIEACRINFINQSNFLLSRPDLMGVVGSLCLGNRATETLVSYGLDAIFDDTFYEPVFKAFVDVILNCKNLRTLSLNKVDVSVEILQAISALPHLTVLDYGCCTVTTQAIESIVSGGIIGPSSSVWNLMLLDTSDNLASVWLPVPLYPNLRTLSVLNHRETLEPPGSISQRSKVFASLENLFIGHIDDEGVTELARWIELNSAEAPLKLTHLKITATFGLDDGPMFALIDALETAPLEVLVIDGIKEGSFELFNRIAAKCPQLLGLTVIRRENILQKEAKLATWPHASFEYAPHFSAFQRLEHFSWNFRVMYLDPSPAGILYFEDGFISEDEADMSGFSSAGLEDSDYFLDSHYIAYPFAAHCQTLKSFAIVSGNMTETFCVIKRRENRQFELVPLDINKRYSTGVLDKWDTSILQLHWPYVLPNRNFGV
ncbi:hypothetical protein BDQ17DRAFT_1361021 [Cyathus striatus]|nr:hypothetical protein BDQ17DRAFT_1361021 [Cyathus striatus]